MQRRREIDADQEYLLRTSQMLQRRHESWILPVGRNDVFAGLLPSRDWTPLIRPEMRSELY